MKKNGILKITLQSDLCIGSGLSYAGVIDQDVVYDEDGFPYIPARRIKGCLREAANIVAQPEQVNRLLGKAGQEIPGSIYIENAKLSGIEELQGYIKRCEDEELKHHLSVEDILGLYTTVRLQTAIDETTGTARENSLRMTRVVNQYNPMEDGISEPLCFEARIYYEEADAEESEKFLKKAAKAMRHMGMNRNRGLGNVKCEFLTATSCIDESTKGDIRDMLDITPMGETVKITYELMNTEPLMISDSDKDDSASYISGKSIIGVFAATYIRKKKMKEINEPADTKEFADLFLNGKVKYYNANLAINGKRSVPAPLYLNRLKKTKKLVNMLADEGNKELIRSNHPEYDWENGNQPKKLKTEYVLIDDATGKLLNAVGEPDRELSFHNRHAHGEKDPEAILYNQEALAAGQKFIGVIEAPKEYEEEILKLFEYADFRIGKSRNAQYGACKLVPYIETMTADCAVENTSNRSSDASLSFNKGDVIAVSLLSDSVFINDNACYTVRHDEVKEQIARKLCISEQKISENIDASTAKRLQQQADKSIIQTKMITGYNTKWNRKRDAVPAVQAGSVFVYVLEQDWEWNDCGIFVGERNQEGFGEAAITCINQIQYNLNNDRAIIKNSQENMDENSSSQGNERKELPDNLQKALCQILYPKMVRSLMESELDNKQKNSLTASAIGRVTLMFKECASEHPEIDNPEDNEALAMELFKRIASIKDGDKQEEAKKIISCVKEGVIDTEKLTNLISDKGFEIIMKTNGYLSDERKQALLKKVWREWMMEKLALLKYRKKED